jgi:tetratricopeptide (TPR) repeat protein
LKTLIVYAPAVLALATFTALSLAPLQAMAGPPAPASPSSIEAEPSTPAALFRSGEARYEAADYAGALADFQDADSAQPSPQAARFIGLCQDKLGHFRAAATAYLRFLAAPPAKLAGEVGAIVRRLEEIKTMPGEVDIEPVPAGAAALQPPPRPGPSVTRTTVALWAAGAAAVGAGVATAFGVLALENKSAYQRNPTYSNSDNGNNDAAYADGGIALALAAGITSLVLYLTSDTGHDTDPAATAGKTRSSLSASPLVTLRGGGAGALLRF